MLIRFLITNMLMNLRFITFEINQKLCPCGFLRRRMTPYSRSVMPDMAGGLARMEVMALIVNERFTHDQRRVRVSLINESVQLVQALATDIVCLAIENELLGRRSGDSRQTEQIERIKRYMVKHLGDADLDIALIVSECHIAPRTIHRLFAVEGTTAIRWLWQQRLAESYRVLAEGRVKQVSEAAINCGFFACHPLSNKAKADLVW
jgi:AraC-like DNA-binding protein